MLYCLLAGGYLILFGYLFIQGYLLGDATFWVGVCLVPFVMISSQRQQRSRRLGIVVLALVALCFFAKAVSLRYLLALTSVVFMIESLYGKLNALLIFNLLIISPLFRYVSEVFTFPIRLQMSTLTGVVLRIAGFQVNTSGNIIQMSDSDFAVDPVCMGLQMMGFSFLAGVFLISHFQKQTGKEIALGYTLLIMAGIFTLNLLSNLMRILVLVVFSISPDNPMHDVSGAVALIIYVWLPVTFLIKFTFKNYGRSPIEDSVSRKPAPFFTAAVNVATLTACLFFTLQSPQVNIRKDKGSILLPDKHYNIARLENGVTRYRSDQALIYLKRMPAFYSTDHSPVTCWKGSGYAFVSIKEEYISGKKIYTGILKKGEAELQTAWWFTNSSHTTLSQLDWRWRMLLGQPGFQLVNVTTSTRTNLQQTVRQWLHHKPNVQFPD